MGQCGRSLPGRRRKQEIRRNRNGVDPVPESTWSTPLSVCCGLLYEAGVACQDVIGGSGALHAQPVVAGGNPAVAHGCPEVRFRSRFLLVDKAPAGVQAVQAVTVQRGFRGLVEVGGFFEKEVELRMCQDGFPSLSAVVLPFGYSS